MPTAYERAVVRVAAGEAAAAAFAISLADAVLYAADSYKVRRQNGAPAVVNPRVLFRGAAPVILLGSAPSMAFFFGLFTPVRAALGQADGRRGAETEAEAARRGAVAVLAASVLCAVPSSLLGVPADTVKKRLLADGPATSAAAAARQILEQKGWRGLFVGARANVIRDVPFAALKLGAYEIIASKYLSWSSGGGGGGGGGGGREPARRPQTLSGTEASIVGFGSGAVVAALTTPLDVVNTRLKSGTAGDATTLGSAARHVVKTAGVAGLFRGALLRVGIIGVGSSIFWWVHNSTKRVLVGDNAYDLLLERQRH